MKPVILLIPENAESLGITVFYDERGKKKDKCFFDSKDIHNVLLDMSEKGIADEHRNN